MSTAVSSATAAQTPAQPQARAEIVLSLDFSGASARVVGSDGRAALISVQIPAVIDVSSAPDDALGRLWRRSGFDSLTNILAKLLHEHRPTVRVGPATVEIYGLAENTAFRGSTANTRIYAQIQAPLEAVPKLAELEKRRREAEKKLLDEVERVVGVRAWPDPDDPRYLCLNEECSRRKKLADEQLKQLEPIIEEYRRTAEEIEGAMERGEPVLDFVRSLGRLTLRLVLRA